MLCSAALLAGLSSMARSCFRKFIRVLAASALRIPSRDPAVAGMKPPGAPLSAAEAPAGADWIPHAVMDCRQWTRTPVLTAGNVLPSLILRCQSCVLAYSVNSPTWCWVQAGQKVVIFHSFHLSTAAAHNNGEVPAVHTPRGHRSPVRDAFVVSFVVACHLRSMMEQAVVKAGCELQRKHQNNKPSFDTM